jgi:aerotaxis receptor
MKKNLPVTQNEVHLSEHENILSTTNLKGIVTYVNESFMRISGFNSEELLGNSHNIVRHPDMPPVAFKGLWDTIKTGKSWIGIVKNRCKNGDFYWVDAYVTPIRKNGETVEYQSVRRKADPVQIRRAEQIYAALSQGQTPPVATSKNKSIRDQIQLPLVVSGTIAVLAIVLAPWWYADLIIMAALGGYMTHVIRKATAPIEKALKFARQITDDPVTQFIYTGDTSDAGQILMAMKILEAEKTALLGRINDMSGVLADGSKDLEHAMHVSQQGYSDQYRQVERVAAAVEEMSATIQDVSNNAAETSAAANHSLQNALEGKRVVDQSVQSLSALQSQIRVASEVVAEVAGTANSIAAILDIIRSISEQTNLLALNATIEAARAGAAGRGFAVVADEVRSLASRTNASTEEIRSVIEKLQHGVTKAVRMMQEGEEMTRISAEQSHQTIATLEEILQSMKRITSQSEEIAYVVDQQRLAANEVNQSISAITVLSEDNLKGIERNARAGSKISTVITGLDELTNHFWLEQNTRLRSN